MDPFNHNDTNPLRSTDLMIAYLEDRAGEEDIIKIESLLESDELYRLSMETLADQIADNREQAQMRIKETESGFEDALEAAKTNFINQLEQGSEVSDQTQAPGQAIPWWSYVIAIALIGAMAWALLSLNKDPQLHKNPIENLLVTTDEAHVNEFMNNCGGAGIGRPQTATVYSALVEQFAAENYEVAAKQFQEILPGLSNPCKAYAAFYEGQSLVATRNFDKAEDAFEAVLKGEEVNPSLKNATLWFLANLKLARGANKEAKTHFSALIQAQNDPTTNLHIKQLMDNGYLLDTEKYLTAL